MKTLNDVYDEITSSEESKEKFIACKSEEEIVDFVKSFGADATFDEIKAFLEEKQGNSDEVSEEDLRQVAGGKKANGVEAAVSIFGLGFGCIWRAIDSANHDSCGTAIEGDGMLCGTSLE